MILDGHVEVHAAGHASILHQYAQARARDHQLGNEPGSNNAAWNALHAHDSQVAIPEMSRAQVHGGTHCTARSQTTVCMRLWLGDDMHSSTAAAVWGKMETRGIDVLV